MLVRLREDPEHQPKKDVPPVRCYAHEYLVRLVQLVAESFLVLCASSAKLKAYQRHPYTVKKLKPLVRFDEGAEFGCL